MKQDVFAQCHPAVNFFYFALVIGCSMFVMHPIFLALSCIGGFAYYVYLQQWKAIKTGLWLMLPVFVLTAVVNPLFTHQGVTILGYFSSGNPFTLESVVYGLAAGVMLVCVLNWFSCYQQVMTSDKFIYLFGRLIPALSLVLSMVLRFAPRFKAQIHRISDAQKCIGRDVTNGNAVVRARNGMKILSIMTTWALENSVETADSMKSRGYGLRGRSNYSIYRFAARDKILCAVLALIGSIVFGGILLKIVYSRYYPMIVLNESTPGALLVYGCYGILCLFPVMMNLIEDVKWHYLKSKI